VVDGFRRASQSGVYVGGSLAEPGTREPEHVEQHDGHVSADTVRVLEYRPHPFVASLATASTSNTA
jgi:hypothetical protein